MNALAQASKATAVTPPPAALHQGVAGAQVIAMSYKSNVALEQIVNEPQSTPIHQRIHSIVSEALGKFHMTTYNSVVASVQLALTPPRLQCLHVLAQLSHHQLTFPVSTR